MNVKNKEEKQQMSDTMSDTMFDTLMGELKRIVNSTGIEYEVLNLLTDEMKGSAPTSQLVILLKQGLFPEVLLTKLHIHLEEQQIHIGQFDDIIDEMMEERVAFAAKNMDLSHDIFEEKTDWWYIPELCVNLATSPDLVADNKPTYSQEDIRIKLNYSYSKEYTSETKLMALLLGLLYELGNADNLKTSPSFSMVTVHNVEMRTEIHSHKRKCSVEICFKKKDEERAVLMAGAVAEVVEKAYKHVFAECKVSRSDSNEQYNLEEESRQAHGRIEDEMRRNSFQRGNPIVTSHL